MSLPAQPNQSLIRGLECLQAVATAREPVGSRELARLTGLEHTTVSRLLGTLAHLGLVRRTANRKYRPGPGLHVLSAQSLLGSGLLAKALPHLRSLAREQLMLAMGVLWNRSVCYLVHAQPGQAPAEAIGAHQPYPAAGSIIGITLLAQLADDEVRARYAGPDSPLRGAALETFIRGLEEVRRNGYALKHLQPGQTSLAFPVGTPVVAAVSLTGSDIPPARIPGLIARLGASAAAITDAWGEG